jgi:hypothetical protein
MCQRRAGSYSDIDELSSATAIAGTPPTNISFHLIASIESTHFQQTVGQAKCHRRVVGPLPSFKSELSASGHISDRIKAAGRLKFNTGSNGVAHSETK